MQYFTPNYLALSIGDVKRKKKLSFNYTFLSLFGNYQSNLSWGGNSSNSWQLHGVGLAVSVCAFLLVSQKP